MAVSHCITWFQIQLILTACQIRYRIHCWILVELDSFGPWEYCACSVPAVRTQCKILYVGNYLNPSFGLFSLVSCSTTDFFYASYAMRMWHI